MASRLASYSSRPSDDIKAVVCTARTRPAFVCSLLVNRAGENGTDMQAVFIELK